MSEGNRPNYGDLKGRRALRQADQGCLLGLFVAIRCL